MQKIKHCLKSTDFFQPRHAFIDRFLIVSGMFNHRLLKNLDEFTTILFSNSGILPTPIPSNPVNEVKFRIDFDTSKAKGLAHAQLVGATIRQFQGAQQCTELDIRQVLETDSALKGDAGLDGANDRMLGVVWIG